MSASGVLGFLLAAAVVFAFVGLLPGGGGLP